MGHLTQANLFRETLRRSTDFELAGSDPVTGHGYRVTVRSSDFDCSAFFSVPKSSLRQAVAEGLAVSIGRTQYVIEPTFGSDFLKAVSDSSRISVVSVTIQIRQRIVSLLGNDVLRLTDLLGEWLPATLQWEPESLVEGSREWGRKVGHAAKDLAVIRETTLGVNDLVMLERSGESEAYEAVHKEAVWPAPDFDALRKHGVVPEVAFGIVSCWRMLKHRPARNPAARLAFVRELSAIPLALEKCRSLDEFANALKALVAALSPDTAAVVGPRLRSFVLNLCSGSKWYSRHDKVLCDLHRIDEASRATKWKIARAALTPKSVARRPAGLPIPSRQSIPFNQLQRSGPDLPAALPLNGNSSALGLTGLELGNYVSQREGQVLARLVAESLTDLRYLIGDWVVHLCRRGNLSIALGSRGKGKACAHYEPGLRVINLTKLRGDGSLAHEFAHFLDHMLAVHATEGESRYLSARVIRQQKPDGPVALAMAHVMESTMSASRRETVAGEVKPERWYREAWITRQGYSREQSAQESYDRIANERPDVFRQGRSCKANSVTLVHTLAKLIGSRVSVEIAFEEPSQFSAEAVRLGGYWKRPEELFARAFESFIEDELSARGQCSQYLVFDTQRDYAGCRGLPYPVGDERLDIAKAMRSLVAACANSR
jgi:hypothetical protein